MLTAVARSLSPTKAPCFLISEPRPSLCARSLTSEWVYHCWLTSSWLAMEDMQAVNGASNTSRVSPHEMNDTAQQLKHLLAQLDPEVGSIH
jgi:hypothetical protein